jgi:hypothetical protein
MRLMSDKAAERRERRDGANGGTARTAGRRERRLSDPDGTVGGEMNTTLRIRR